MYSTSRALNSANRSLKSWFIGSYAVPGETLSGQLPDGIDALSHGSIDPVVLRRRLAAAKGLGGDDAALVGRSHRGSVPGSFARHQCGSASRRMKRRLDRVLARR